MSNAYEPLANPSPRFVAIIAKEFIQMRRDRMTFGMMVRHSR